jgi:hypothetical protein
MTTGTKEFTKGDFTPLQDGEYLIRMNRVEDVTTSKGGRAVKSSFQVVKRVGGDAEEKGVKNRLVWHYFNYENPNPKAQEIGNEQLDKYLQAVGVNGGLEGIGYDMGQLSDFLEIPFIANLKEVPEKSYVKDGETRTAKPSNKITAFKSR